MISNPITSSNTTTTINESEDPIIVDYVSDIDDDDNNNYNSTTILQQQHINTNQSTFINEIATTTTNTTSMMDELNNTSTSNETNNSSSLQSLNQQQHHDQHSLKTSTSNHSNSTTTTTTSNSMNDDDSNNMWSCNICFDTASEPVITQCGHLYCWSCIYRWMQSHSTQNLQCPVCKAGIQQDKLIPIYGRGCSHSQNQNHQTNINEQIPSRPRGQYTDSRTTPNPNYNPFHNMTNIFGNFNTNTSGIGAGFRMSSNQFLFSDAFRFFPFFDLASNNSNNGVSGNRNHLVPPPTEQEELQGFVRRLALFLGFILLFYIIFV